MNGRTFITRKFLLLLVAMVFAGGIMHAGFSVESTSLMITGVTLAWASSRYGCTTLRGSYCNLFIPGSVSRGGYLGGLDCMVKKPAKSLSIV